jgi:hypothetical protein
MIATPYGNCNLLIQPGTAGRAPYKTLRHRLHLAQLRRSLLRPYKTNPKPTGLKTRHYNVFQAAHSQKRSSSEG